MPTAGFQTLLPCSFLLTVISSSTAFCSDVKRSNCITCLVSHDISNCNLKIPTVTEISSLNKPTSLTRWFRWQFWTCHATLPHIFILASPWHQAGVLTSVCLNSPRLISPLCFLLFVNGSNIFLVALAKSIRALWHPSHLMYQFLEPVNLLSKWFNSWLNPDKLMIVFPSSHFLGYLI